MFPAFINFLRIAACIVDQDIDTAIHLQDAVHHRCGLFSAGQVPGERGCCSAVFADQSHCLVKVGLGTGDCDNSGSFGCRGKCGGPADSLSGTGDDGDFIF